mgnify:CR=1 FL=1
MADTSNQIETVARLNRNLGLLQAGSKVTLDLATPAGQKAKFRSLFVGYLSKQYVLVQYPDANKVGNFAQYMTQGTSVTVRGLIEGHEGAVVAFISNIRQTLQMPSRLLVLEFPKTVRLQALRSSIRIDTDIIAKVKIKSEYWRAELTDLSINGCQIFVNNGEELVLSSDNKIEIVIEDFQGLSNLKLEAEVCNNKQVTNGLAMGLKFLLQSKSEVTKLLHHAITLEGD